MPPPPTTAKTPTPALTPLRMQTLTPLQSVAVSEGVGVWHSRRQFPCRHGYEMLIPMSLPMSMQTRLRLHCAHMHP